LGGRSGATAKVGLNKALLSSVLGVVLEFIAYTAAQRNKLVLKVSRYNSSNECAACGHPAPANRSSQAEFGCTKCAHVDNADSNEARVFKQRCWSGARW